MPIDPNAVTWDPAPVGAGSRVVGRTPPLPKAPAGYKPGPTLSLDPGFRQGEVGLARDTAAARAGVEAGKERSMVDYRNAAELSQRRALMDMDSRSSGVQLERGNKLRDDFGKIDAVKNYNVVLPLIASAMRAPSGGAGDLETIYAFAKVMDPGSSVREGEMDNAQRTAPVAAYAEKLAQRVREGNLLRPEERKGLIEAMRRRASEYGSGYSQSRYRFADLARKAGIDPIDVIGDHAGRPYQQAEANFLGRPIRNRDGTQGAKPTQKNASGIKFLGFE